MGLKKYLRKKRVGFHSKTAATASILAGKLGYRLRLKGRIRLANRWAAQNPKKATAITVSLLLGSFIASFFIQPTEKNETPALDNIIQVNGVIESMSRVDALKRMQREQLVDITKDMQKTKDTLDSLLALENKSRADSLEIVAKCKKLELFANTISHEKN